MKNLFLGLVLLSSPFVAGLRAADTSSGPVNVTINSEATELAAGYARAFLNLRSVPFHVQLEREGGKTIFINDIKRISAVGAVLLLETGKGLLYVVNPKDIVWFSDAPMEKSSPISAR